MMAKIRTENILNSDVLLKYEALDPLPKPRELRASTTSLSRKFSGESKQICPEIE